MNSSLSILVGLKNNLEYSKNFYHTTRSLYPSVEIVFTSYSSTDGTHEWLDSLQDDKVIYYHSPEDKTLSDTYNKCAELASNDYVIFAHNDIVLTPGFLENLEKRIAPDKVISYTTIEPPIFASDPRPWKIIKDFGIDVQTFDRKGLYTFSSQLINKNEISEDVNGASFFLCVYRRTLLEIGGFDPLYNPMFCEDDDLLLRLALLGLKMLIAPDVICYHFVSKTSRFSDKYINKSKEIEINSNRNFVRKWGFSASSSIKPRYNIGLAVKNGNAELLEKLEPWCSTIYIDCDADEYIRKEQSKTMFDLKVRIKPYDAAKTNNVLVSLNGKKFQERTFNRIKSLAEVITREISSPPNILFRLLGKNNKKFKDRGLKIEIFDTLTYERNRITVNKEYNYDL